MYRGTFKDDVMLEGVYRYADNNRVCPTEAEAAALLKKAVKLLKTVGTEWHHIEHEQRQAKLRRIRKAMHKKSFSTDGLFTLMDVDSSNTVNYAEFSKGLALTGIRPMPMAREIKEMFDELDVNDDGKVTWEEMLESWSCDATKQDTYQAEAFDKVAYHFNLTSAGEDPLPLVFKGIFSNNLPRDGVVVYSDESYFKGMFRSKAKGTSQESIKPCTGAWYWHMSEKTPCPVTATQNLIPQAYIGEWKEGKQHGVGKMHRHDGATFNGKWRDGLPLNGIWMHKVPMHDDDYTKCGFYAGQWAHGVRMGHGTFDYSIGDHYDGEWDVNMRHGEGTMYFNSAENGVGHYAGEFRNDKKYDGDIDGSRWQDQHGQWCEIQERVKIKNGLVYGHNTLKYEPGAMRDGGIFVGMLAEGKVAAGEWINYEQGPSDEYGLYNGPVLRGARHGYGTCHYPNGDVFKGEFVNGVRLGPGVCQYADGAIFSGIWTGDTSRGDAARSLSRAKSGEWIMAKAGRVKGLIIT